MKLPAAPGKYVQADQGQMRAQLEREDQRNLKRDADIEAANGVRIILRSPNGSRWALSVDNSGVVSAVAA